MLRLIGVALAIYSGAAIAGPSGRVVRVERAASRVAPRLCEIHGDSGTCVGEEPRSGQPVAVLDERHVVAELEIVEAVSFSATCPALWTVKTRPQHGPANASDGLGVIDPGLDLGRARLIDRNHLPASPSGFTEDEVWRAIDRDGDGAADIVITRYGCDASGRPTPGATFCIDIWSRAGARLTRTTRLNFALCNR